jgi:ribosomal protein S27AE
MPRKPPTRELAGQCVVCGAAFNTFTPKQKYCGRVCRIANYKPYFAEYSKRNAQKVSEKGRAWYERNRERRLAQCKSYNKTPTGKALRQESYKRTRERHPEKYAARQAVLIALRAGRLVKQPCERCGEVKVQAHHDDYTRQLDVRWLCQPCHIEHHKEEKARRAAEENAMSEENQIGVYIEDGSVAAVNGVPVEVASV